MSNELLRELIKKIEGEIGFVGIEVWGSWVKVGTKEMRAGYSHTDGKCRFVAQYRKGKKVALAETKGSRILDALKGEVPGLIDQIMIQVKTLSGLGGQA